MPLEPTPEILEKISTLSELANTFDQAAIGLGVTPEAFADFLGKHPEARERWTRGGLDAINQLRICLTKQAYAGSVQASKVLAQMHKDAAPQKNAPIASAPTSTPKKQAGRAWRYVSCADAALEVGGVSTKFVENLVREGKTEETAGRPNPVPMSVGKSGEWRVQPGAVYAWILERIKRGISSRPPKGLVEPAGYADAQEPETVEPRSTPASLQGLELNFEKIISAVLAGKDLSNEDKKIFIAIAESIRRNTDSEERRQDKIDKKDVIKMLGSLGEIYCIEIEANANAKALDFLRIIRDQFQIDLKEKNSAALSIISSALCDQSNRLEIPAIRKAVREQVEGIELLEGMA